MGPNHNDEEESQINDPAYYPPPSHQHEANDGFNGDDTSAYISNGRDSIGSRVPETQYDSFVQDDTQSIQHNQFTNLCEQESNPDLPMQELSPTSQRLQRETEITNHFPKPLSPTGPFFPSIAIESLADDTLAAFSFGTPPDFGFPANRKPQPTNAQSINVHGNTTGMPLKPPCTRRANINRFTANQNFFAAQKSEC